MTKTYNFTFYIDMLNEYIQKYHQTSLEWNGKIIRKRNIFA